MFYYQRHIFEPSWVSKYFLLLFGFSQNSCPLRAKFSNLAQSIKHITSYIFQQTVNVSIKHTTVIFPVFTSNPCNSINYCTIKFHFLFWSFSMCVTKLLDTKWAGLHVVFILSHFIK